MITCTTIEWRADDVVQTECGALKLGGSAVSFVLHGGTI